MKRLLGTLIFSLALVPHASSQMRTDCETGGLKGPVKAVRVEQAELAQDGQTIKRPRQLQSVTTYDERGNLIEALSYHPDGTLREKKTLSWDGDGHRIAVKYDADGRMTAKSVETFDAAGHITGTLSYDAAGALKSRSASMYDERGRFTGGAVYNPDGSLMSKTVVTFDEKNQQPEIAYYDAQGTLQGKHSLSDAGGYVINYQPDGTEWFKETRTALKWEFDAHGNWIKQTWPKTRTQANKIEESVEVLYREITYY
jgi:YD repeat-containing protein